MNAPGPASAQRLVAIGLGSSLGPRRDHIEQAVRALDRVHGQRLVRCSRLVRTPPMRGGSASGWFLNAVALYRSELSPHAILARCRALEDSSGRRRSRHWGDRTLDLDVLLDELHAVHEPALQIPHPSLADRRFVLEPLLEVWPDARHPSTGALYRAMPPASGPRPTPIGVLARPR